MASPLSYLCTATFSLDDSLGDERRGELGKELLHFVWDRLPATEKRLRRNWFLNRDANILRLNLTVADRAAGLDRLRAVSAGFLEHLQQTGELHRRTPSQAEDVLIASVQTLRSELDQA